MAPNMRFTSPLGGAFSIREGDSGTVNKPHISDHFLNVAKPFMNLCGTKMNNSEKT
jgi:hypothetical protein